MLLRQKLLPWANAAALRGEEPVIDAELRAYARSFATPLIVLAVLGAALMLAAWFAELA
jgi:hypothetical protein